MTDMSNTRIVERIDATLPKIDKRDPAWHALSYVRSQVTPEGLKARGEENQDVKHLRECAASHLKQHETKES